METDLPGKENRRPLRIQRTIALRLPAAKALKSVDVEGATVKEAAQDPLAREVALKADAAAKIRIAFEQ